MLRLFLFLIVMFSSNVFSASNATNTIVWVNSFETMATTAASMGFNQASTGLNNSCGVFSLDHVVSYHEIYKKGASFVSRYSHPTFVNRIKSIYTGMGVPYNSFTSTDQLKNYVNSYGIFYKAVKAGDNTATNLSNMKNWLKQDFPVIIALEGNFYNNPVYPFEHIVVLYKYDTVAKKIWFFDPYYGGTQYINADSIANIEAAVQGNLPYLRIYSI
jgi:hypothetical protein